MTRVSDLHIVSNTPLPSPRELIARIPRDEAQAARVAAHREAIRNVLIGDDPRFLVITGPCSIHDVDAGIEYAERLTALAREVGDQLLLVMRVYFEKPRTTTGWKGLIMDPHLDGTHDIPAGLEIARRFLGSVLDLGLPTATEFLDPITPQYIADRVCWAAIGARTTESQTHRQMASGLSMPVGFKNATSGAVQPAINAVKASMQPQTFLGIDDSGRASAVTTRGNPACHIILRGSDDGANCSPEDVARALERLGRNGLQPAVVIDASHGNCGKDSRRMPGVFTDIVRQRAGGTTGIIGAMLESNLVGGNQAFPQPRECLIRGQSITDPCIDWETTESLIRETAAALSRR